MNKKNKLITLLASISCVAFSAGVGIQASANGTQTPTKTIGPNNIDVSSFRMSYGAEMRFDPNDPTEPAGIRFAATLEDEAYTELEKLDGVNYGIVIVPADILAEHEITEANLFSETDAYYCFRDPKKEGETEGCTCAKQHVASVEYEVMYDAKATDGVKNVRGSLVGILDNNLTREYVGLGYIEYNGTYVLADHAYGKNADGEDDGISDIKNNTRSVTYIAQIAIENEQDDEDGTLKTNFVDKLGDKKYKYTVNHYIPDENGEYTTEPTATETLGAVLGTEVTATHITKSSIPNAATEYKAYRVYEFDKETSNTTSVMYANGRTVLNAYYTPRDTTFYDTVVGNEPGYKFMGANTNTETKTKLEGATTNWHDSLTLGGETKEGVVQINTTAADQYTAGKFNLALDRDYALIAKEYDWAYIKLHMYIVVGEFTDEEKDPLSHINFLSKNKMVAENVPTGEWTNVIVPLARLNQPDTYVITKNANNGGTSLTKEEFYQYSYFDGKYMWDGSTGNFLCTNSVKTGIGLTTTDITYYIDEISWGIDSKAPEISVSGITNKMLEGTFTEPTVTVTDDMSPKALLDTTIVKTLYKKDGETRTPVELTDGCAELTAGNYVYVVTADDRIYTDVAGNVATKEIEFEVVEKYEITFGSSEETNYFQKNTEKTYDFTTSYLDADALAAQGLNAGDIGPEGGAIKIVTGTESGGAYGAWLKLKLSDDEIALVSTATTITFRMYVQVGTYTNWPNTTVGCEVDLLDGGTAGTHLAGCDKDAWVDVVVTVADLEKAYSTYLDGTNVLFWVGSTTVQTDSTVTYYINSITFA